MRWICGQRGLPCKPDSLSLDPPGTHVIAHICKDGTPALRWKAETGQDAEVHRPVKLRDTVASVDSKGDPASHKVEGKNQFPKAAF